MKLKLSDKALQFYSLPYQSIKCASKSPSAFFTFDLLIGFRSKHVSKPFSKNLYFTLSITSILVFKTC
jgi:hypothetical protein